MTRKTIVTFVSVAALALAAGVGWAAIPSSDGVITACRATNGTIKVIDSEAGQSCSSSQTTLRWNIQGPAGARGPQGPAGQSAEIGMVVVQPDGSAFTTLSVYPVTATSKIGTGSYEIDFGPSMLACARWATVASGARMVAVGHLSSDHSKLRVQVYDAAGVAVDSPVQVHVSC